LCTGLTQYASAPANGDLNSHPGLSAWTLDFNVPVKHTSCAAPKFPATRQVFDLSTSKWGHVRVTRVVGFLPANFQLPMPFRSRRIASDTGQIDRQTDRRRPSIYNAPLYGAGA